MARLPVLTRDQAPEEYLEAFDEETAASGGVVDSGPGSVMIYSPEMRRRANHFVGYFREVTDLPHKLQDLAMLLTARHMDCQYIWYAHAARGRQQGLSDELVDALRDRKPLPDLPSDEAALVAYRDGNVQQPPGNCGHIPKGGGPIWHPLADRTDDHDGLLHNPGVPTPTPSRLTCPKTGRSRCFPSDHRGIQNNDNALPLSAHLPVYGV